MFFEPVTDINKKKLLKNIVRDCINVKKDPYDFRDEYIKSSDFNFCPLSSQFFDDGSGDEPQRQHVNLINYCIDNNYQELFVISTESIDNEESIHYSEDWPFALAYKFKIGKDNLFSLGVNFTYGISALLFPEDLSFLILLTDSYDIIVGKRDFIEEVIHKDIVYAVDSFEEDISFIINDTLRRLSNKYKTLIHSKYG